MNLLGCVIYSHNIPIKITEKIADLSLAPLLLLASTSLTAQFDKFLLQYDEVQHSVHICEQCNNLEMET